MATKKKPSAKQLAARAKFVAMVRAKSKAKKSGSPKKVTVKKAAVKKKATPKKRVVKKRSVSGVTIKPKLKILSKRELVKLGWAMFQHGGGAKYIINGNHTVKFTAQSELTLRKKASEYLSNL